MRCKFLVRSVIIIVALFSAGCGIHREVEISKKFPPPQKNDFQLIPELGRGKEIITRGDGKEVLVDTVNFEIINDEIRGKSKDFIITIKHVRFDEIAKKYGVPISISHPLDQKYKPYHSTGPWDAPAFRTFYRSEHNYPYQEVLIVPFYTPKKPEIFRSEKNDRIYKDLQSDFASGKIQPLTLLGDQRSPREIKDQMSELIGQPYYDRYFANTSMFYVSIENRGDNKIRLWPRENSVLINELNQQYEPLPKANVDEEYEIWRKYVDEWNSAYKGKPSLGLMLHKKEMDGLYIISLVDGGPAQKAGVKKDSKIISLNGKKINEVKDLLKILDYKEAGEEVELKVKDENGENHEYTLILESGDHFAKNEVITVLDGGNIYPRVAYDGYLLFRAAGANVAGSKFRLIIPLIASDFNAADVPFRSYELEFNFVNKARHQ